MNQSKNTIADLCAELREQGCAVICFTPDELRGADPLDVEDRLVELGWDVIDAYSEEDDSDA